MNENNFVDNYEMPMPEAEKTYILVLNDGGVLFPGHLGSFSVNAKSSVSALMQAVETNRDVFFIYSRSPERDGDAIDSLPRIGTTARIKQLIKNSNGGSSLWASSAWR